MDLKSHNDVNNNHLLEESEATMSLVDVNGEHPCYENNEETQSSSGDETGISSQIDSDVGPQSSGGSLGSPGIVNSPMIKTKCFYGSGSSSLPKSRFKVRKETLPFVQRNGKQNEGDGDLNNNCLFRYFKATSKTENLMGNNVGKVNPRISENKKQLKIKSAGDVNFSIGDVTIEDLTTSVASSKNAKKPRKPSTSPKNGGQKFEQLYIDVGQKNFGHITCPDCGMVYTKTLPEDALQHSKYHQKLMQKLKFKGWKTERVLQEFHDGRIIQINQNDNSLHLKKVAELREVVDGELGFAYATTEYSSVEKAFLFVSNNKITGCAIAVPITKAYPVITAKDTSSPEKRQGVPTLSWCCSSDPVPALCGISRIWVLKKARRQKVAARLIDAVRSHFIFGVVIGKEKVAFSDPTPDGRLFAEKYSETPNILVFR